MKRTRLHSRWIALLLALPPWLMIVVWIISKFHGAFLSRFWAADYYADPAHSVIVINRGNWWLESLDGVALLRWHCDRKAIDIDHWWGTLFTSPVVQWQPVYGDLADRMDAGEVEKKFWVYDTDFQTEHTPDQDFELRQFMVREWVLVVLFSVPLAVYLWKRNRSRGQMHPLCDRCGYDLRMHKPGDKCPECGTVIEDKSV